MNGAEALVQTLARCGVNTYFANPGTSEMHLVSALARERDVRLILCLFEGVATGAADGYGRMRGVPAATLLHLGPGYANGGANLHNARKAMTPLLNIVGDHATYHRRFDAPLTSDIAAWAAPNSRWVKSADKADEIGPLASEAVTSSYGPPGGCATLIVPADSAWSSTSVLGHASIRPRGPSVDAAAVSAAAAALAAAAKPVLFLGGECLREAGLQIAARLVNARRLRAPLRIMSETFPARQARGRGRLAPNRMMYFAEQALADLDGVDVMVAVGAPEPIAFFAYPGRPSRLAPEGCRVTSLAKPGANVIDALSGLSDLLEGTTLAERAAPPPPPPPLPQGALNPKTVGISLARHLPNQAIVSDDGVTSSLPIFLLTSDAQPHDWLALTGGAIGQGLPLAVGAAVACPERKVISLNGDGAAMYTIQALWTIARERLDVTVIIFANDIYAILQIELARTGANTSGAPALPVLRLDDPSINWSKLGESLGLRCSECLTAESFDAALAHAMQTAGPELIVVRLPPSV
jgi:acetolactate synthase-1/2/3 large subunit